MVNKKVGGNNLQNGTTETPAQQIINYWLRSSEGTKAERCHQLCERIWGLLTLRVFPETQKISSNLWEIVDFDELCELAGRYGVTGIPTKFDLGDILEVNGEHDIPGI